MRPVQSAVVALVVVLLTLAAAPPPPVLPVTRPKPVWEIEGEEQPGILGEAVDISPGGHLVAAAVGRQVQVYARTSGKRLYTLDEPRQDVRGAGFVEEHLLVTTTYLRPSDGGEIEVARLSWWDLRTREKIRSIDYDSDLGSPLFSPNRKLMFLGSGKRIDWEVVVRESATGKLVRELRLEGYGGVAFTADSKGLLSGTRAGTVSRWDLATGVPSVVCRVDTRQSPLEALAATSDGQTLAASTRHHITLFDLTTGMERCRSLLMAEHWRGLRFVRGDRWLLVCCGGALAVVDTGTGQRARRDVDVCWGSVRAPALTADDRWMVTISRRGTALKLWKLAEW